MKTLWREDSYLDTLLCMTMLNVAFFVSLFGAVFLSDHLFAVTGPLGCGSSLLAMSLPGLVWWITPLRPVKDSWANSIAYGLYVSAIATGTLGIAMLGALGAYTVITVVGVADYHADLIALIIFPVIGCFALSIFYVLGTEKPVTAAVATILGQWVVWVTRKYAVRAGRAIHHGYTVVTNQIKQWVTDVMNSQSMQQACSLFDKGLRPLRLKCHDGIPNSLIRGYDSPCPSRRNSICRLSDK